MDRVATVRWKTPAPTSIDEELALYDDGSAWLVVRRARSDRAAVGAYRTTASAEERRALEGTDLTVDLLHPPADGGAVTAADAIAGRARSAPHAVARFHARAVPGAATLALAVVGEGEEPVAFELEPGGTTVHFLAGGDELSWQEFPALDAGFITPDAVGLGGVHGRATVAPGQFGVVTLAVDVPADADAAALQVAGWLADALPDAPQPERFEARTDPSPLVAPPVIGKTTG
jgi:hypothetical protein